MTYLPLTTVAQEARAKLNPFLRVMGRRADGYHDLETLVLPLELSDTVMVHAFADPSTFRTLSLSLDVTGRPELIKGVPVDETNLALRAAMALADHAQPKGFAEILLDKRIPQAAGLGGGSSDAAVVLRALNGMWGVGLDPDRLQELGATVGSDVPALMAGGPAVARGRGERVTPVRAAAFDWLLVTFPFGVRTKDAFAWWDVEGAPTGPDPAGVLEAAAAGEPDVLGPLLFNDLERPVFERHPDIGEAKRQLLEAGLPGAVMCGSGASVAGLLRPGTHASDLEPLVADLTARAGRAPRVLRSIPGEPAG